LAFVAMRPSLAQLTRSPTELAPQFPPCARHSDVQHSGCPPSFAQMCAFLTSLSRPPSWAVRPVFKPSSGPKYVAFKRIQVRTPMPNFFPTAGRLVVEGEPAQFVGTSNCAPPPSVLRLFGGLLPFPNPLVTTPGPGSLYWLSVSLCCAEGTSPHLPPFRTNFSSPPPSEPHVLHPIPPHRFSFSIFPTR